MLPIKNYNFVLNLIICFFQLMVYISGIVITSLILFQFLNIIQKEVDCNMLLTKKAQFQDLVLNFSQMFLVTYLGEWKAAICSTPEWNGEI